IQHQTESLRHLEWSVLYQEEVQRTLDVLDYPGEVYRLAFLEAKDDPDPESFAKRVTAHKDEINALLEHLVNSDSIFVLFNLSDAQDLATNAANLDAVWSTNVCLNYLHRLPQKPKVTLLLTQIDRYCSREMGIFNAKEYVAQALPLIHANFPSLDVLAIAAVGPTDATFGIKNIIRRCLAETKIVSESIAELKASKELIDQGWEQLLVKNPLDVSQRLLQALKAHYSTRDFSPWLFPKEALVAANVFLTDGAIKECCQIAKCFSNSSTDALSLAYQPLSRLSICSAYGIKVLDYLKVALPKVIKRIEEAKIARIEQDARTRANVLISIAILGSALFLLWCCI
ncbi:MAG: hypothetical protein RSD41_05250, partial [Kiritimatiellia bacterium]